MVGCGRVGDSVLVADGDRREPHHIDVLMAQIDAHRTRQEVTNAVLDLERDTEYADVLGVASVVAGVRSWIWNVVKAAPASSSSQTERLTVVQLITWSVYLCD